MGFAVVSEELHSAAGQVRAVGETGVGTCVNNLKAAVTALNEGLQGAMTASQTALANWSGGQGSVAFDEASQGVRNDFNLINEALNAQVIPAVNRLGELLIRFSKALDDAGTAYTGTDQSVMGEFSSLVGG